jgi:hypothetical protein
MSLHVIIDRNTHALATPLWRHDKQASKAPSVPYQGLSNLLGPVSAVNARLQHSAERIKVTSGISDLGGLTRGTRWTVFPAERP